MGASDDAGARLDPVRGVRAGKTAIAGVFDLETAADVALDTSPRGVRLLSAFRWNERCSSCRSAFPRASTGEEG